MRAGLPAAGVDTPAAVAWAKADSAEKTRLASNTTAALTTHSTLRISGAPPGLVSTRRLLPAIRSGSRPEVSSR